MVKRYAYNRPCPRRKAQQKHTERKFNSFVSDLKPLIINSDSCHWLPTQVRSSHNVPGYSCTVQVRHVLSSRQILLSAGRRKVRCLAVFAVAAPLPAKSFFAGLLRWGGYRLLFFKIPPTPIITLTE